MVCRRHLARHAGLSPATLPDNVIRRAVTLDLQILSDRPEPLVEEPVRVLTEHQPILRVVVAGVRKPVDVRGIDDARATHRGQP
jgi:hypothetical protein